MSFSCLKTKILIISLLLSSIPLTLVAGNNSDVTQPTISLDATNKEWTVLIYMCGDNNLEAFAMDDLNELEAAGGTTADVNVVVMVDQSTEDYPEPEYVSDWTESRYYVIEGDSLLSIFTTPVNTSLGEQNMGDGATLESFVDWGLTNFPANNTALILWDHGGGLDGVCWDDDDNDFLTIDEVDDALEGYYFDLLAFDACIMGHIEILYELQDNCEILVSSLYNIPGDGYPYDVILADLIADPTQTASEWADTIVYEYIDSYALYDVDVTLSAYNTTAIVGIETLVNDFSQALIAALPTYYSSIYNAINMADSYLPEFVSEFYQFIDEVQSISAYGVDTAATNLLNMLDDALIATDSSLSTTPYGLWVFLPSLPYNYINDFYVYSNQSVVNSYYNNYYDLEFVANTDWDNFVYEWRDSVDILISPVSVGSPYSGTLTESNIKYIQADLSDPGAGIAYKATLTMDSFVDFDLYAFNEEAYLGMSNSVSTSSTNLDDYPEVLILPISGVTTVFFMVYAYSGSGSYTLTMETIDYDDDEYEENDHLNTAAYIELNNEYDLIAYDDDFFEIELSSGQNIEIILDFNPSTVDLDLYLVDDQGDVVDYSESYSTTEYLDFTATYTGSYFIYVSYFDGAIGSNYTLGVWSEIGPDVSSINHIPYNPDPGENIQVICTVTGPYTITSVILAYSYDGGSTWTNVTMSASGSEYTGTIPGNENADDIRYKIYATDSEDNSVVTTVKTVTYESSSFIAFPWFMIPVLLVGLAFINKRFFKKLRNKN
ncbi:MAG: clostripain-related cysteine peptidase [Candidatus Heimdallarchaeaceae archaeon]